MYTDHQSTDDQCALMISVAPAVPPAYQCTSMPHISAHLSCLSVSPISASQCHLSVPISAAYQCQSVSSIGASQCRLTVPVS
ncbi:unnamed protein product, partial [Staurois parvus]